jgi:hypothetical protein
MLKKLQLKRSESGKLVSQRAKQKIGGASHQLLIAVFAVGNLCDFCEQSDRDIYMAGGGSTQAWEGMSRTQKNQAYQSAWEKQITARRAAGEARAIKEGPVQLMSGPTPEEAAAQRRMGNQAVGHKQSGPANKRPAPSKNHVQPVQHNGSVQK